MFYYKCNYCKLVQVVLHDLICNRFFTNFHKMKLCMHSLVYKLYIFNIIWKRFYVTYFLTKVLECIYCGIIDPKISQIFSLFKHLKPFCTFNICIFLQQSQFLLFLAKISEFNFLCVIPILSNFKITY